MKLHLIGSGWRYFLKKHAVRPFKHIFLFSITVCLIIGLSGISASAIAQDPFETSIPITIPVIPPKPSPEIRGIWMTNNDMDVMADRPKMQEAVNELARLNFNTIYPVVWNSGYALYPSAVAQRAGIQPFVYQGMQGQDILKELAQQAHEKGLLSIPWFEFGFMAPPMSELAVNHPTWLTQRRDGSKTSLDAGEVAWLNPFHPEVQQFIKDLVLEVITQYDVDGIQFDDRTCLPVEFGYDPYTIALYRQETQQNPPTNPRDPAWMRWRADKITAFMVELHDAVKQRKPNMIFSVSPNPHTFAYNAYLQDWLTWLRRDIIDELIVQVYRNDLNTFSDYLLRPEMQEAQQKIPTGVGILTGLRNRPVAMQLIQDQVLAARARGFGVSFFYFNSLWKYTPDHIAERQSNFQALFSSQANRARIKS